MKPSTLWAMILAAVLSVGAGASTRHAAAEAGSTTSRLQTVEQILAVVPNGVIPSRWTDWTPARIKEANATLRQHVGRAAEWSLQVNEVRLHQGRVLVVAKGVERPDFLLGGSWCFVSSEDDQIDAVTELTPGDQITLKGRVYTCEFRAYARGAYLQFDLEDCVVVEMRTQETSEPAPDLAGFVEEVAPTTEDLPVVDFGRRRSSIGALVVTDTQAGFIGSRIDILAVVALHDGDGRGRLMRGVGKEMRVSFEEALRTVRVDHPRWARGEVQVSFDDKYTPKDGGSAGAAFAVLVSSLLEGFEIDPAFAMTGDITVDGKVRKVGAVGAKVRGAARAGVDLVAVPIDNAQAVTDLAVIDGVDAVLATQVIAVRTLEEAKQLARLDREGEWAEAIRLFGELQENGGRGVWHPSLGDVATLEKVLELCPQHLSADLALQAAHNQLPRTLSASASIDEAFVAIRPIWPDVLEEKLRGRTLDRGTLADLRVRLRRVQVMADARARDLVNAIVAYAGRVDQASRGGLSDADIRRINQTLREIATQAQALGADRELLEELME